MRERTELLKAFAKRVVELRQERGWTQDTLAELACMHRNFIGQVERTELCPSLVSAAKIAAAFDLSLRDFLSCCDQPQQEKIQ